MKAFWFTANSSSNKISSWVYFFVPIFVAIFVGLSHSQEWFKRLDNIIYDSVLSLSEREHSEDVVIVAIDQLSLDTLGHWPWSRGVHAELTEKLSRARAVVFDVLFPENNANDLIGDKKFADAIKNHGRVVLPVHLEALRNKGQLLEIPPAEIFYSAANSVGHVHAYCESDSICRSIFLFEGLGSPYWAHIALQADRIGNLDKTFSPQNKKPSDQSLSHFKRNVLNHFNDIQWREQKSVDDLFVVLSAYQAFIPFDATQKPFVEVSYSEVLSGNIPEDFFDNKTVFVGAMSAGLGDTLSTPAGLKPGVVVNALSYDAFRRDNLIVRTVDWRTTIMMMVFALVLTYVMGRLSPATFLITLVVTLPVLYFFQYLLIVFGANWIPISSLIIGLMAFYPLWNWFKLHIALRFLRQALFRITKSDENSKINHVSYARSIRGAIPNEESLFALGGYSTYFEQDEPLEISNEHRDTNNKSRDGADHALESRTAFHSDHVEVVSRTIHRLQNAMSIAEINHNLIQQSLSNLQDAVVIVNHKKDVVLSNNIADDLFFFEGSKSISNILSTFDGKSRKLLAEKINKVLNEDLEFSDEFEYLGEFHGATNTDTQIVVDGSVENNTKHFLCVGKNISFPIVVAVEHTIDISILTFSDISKIKDVEQSRLDTLNFLSHDLRSPMVSVLALIEQYEIKEKSNSGPGVNTLLSNIRQYVQKNLSYSESILQLSRAEELSEDSFSLVDLHSVLDSTYQQILPIASRAKIVLSVSRADEDLWVMGNYDLLERVLINLLTNGIKFSRAGGTINIDIYNKGSQIHLLVTDHGSGIDTKDLSSVFDRYSRGQNNQKIKTGAGLGLFFVKTVLAKHNGEITVKSKIGQGACFHIVLPSVDPND